MLEETIPLPAMQLLVPARCTQRKTIPSEEWPIAIEGTGGRAYPGALGNKNASILARPEECEVAVTRAEISTSSYLTVPSRVLNREWI